MKRTILAVVAALIPSLGFSALPPRPSALDAMDIRNDFSSFSETTTMEWGCPVADHVIAATKAEALHKIKNECLAEARRAAANKDGVMDVLQTRVIYPDVEILPLSDGYQLTGTYFLETTVVQRTSAEAR